jgi:hypothetical protein
VWAVFPLPRGQYSHCQVPTNDRWLPALAEKTISYGLLKKHEVDFLQENKLKVEQRKKEKHKRKKNRRVAIEANATFQVHILVDKSERLNLNHLS